MQGRSRCSCVEVTEQVDPDRSLSCFRQSRQAGRRQEAAARPGQWLTTRKRHSSPQAFVPPRGAAELMKRFAARKSSQWRSSFKPDIPGPAGLWHFPEKVPREGRENNLPAPPQPPTHSALSDSSSLWGWAGPELSTPALEGPFFHPQRIWGLLGEGGSRGCRECEVSGVQRGGEGSFFPLVL